MIAAAFDPSNFLIAIAALITAIAGAYGTLVALRRSKSAEDKATSAYEASPASVLQGLKSEVRAIVDAYNEASERWKDAHAASLEALEGERDRADAAEAVVMMLRGELATMKIDLAAARVEVSDLRTRFEQSITRREREGMS